MSITYEQATAAIEAIHEETNKLHNRFHNADWLGVIDAARSITEAATILNRDSELVIKDKTGKRQ